MLSPTAMCLQLADQSLRYPAGIAEDIPVRIRNFLVPIDFVVLDMETDVKTLLILGPPFLSTAKANIDVGASMIRLNINGKKEEFAFKPKVEQCNQVKIYRCQAPKNTPKPKVDLSSKEPQIDSLVACYKKVTLREAEYKKQDKAERRRRERAQKHARKERLKTKDAGSKDPIKKVTPKTKQKSKPVAELERKTFATPTAPKRLHIKVWRKKEAAPGSASPTQGADPKA